MDWIKVVIATTAAGIDPVCGTLMNIGICGVEISDKDDFENFLDNNRKYWDYVDEELERLKDADTTITLYVGNDAEGMEQLSSVRSAMLGLKNFDEIHQYGSLNIDIQNVKDEDWSENWKKYFKPIEVGEKILIQPEWEKLNKPTDRTVFTVNPGMTFGTGSHRSTRFCIEEIEKYIRTGDSVLDLGCGSGILSIIAMLLGAGSADAVDIDANAVDVAYANLKLNHVPPDNYKVYAGDIISDDSLREKFGTYDLVIANIVADVIIALSGFVRKFMKPNGIFICSGIIIERVEEVLEALNSAGFEIIEVRKDKEWAAITAK
ncbi:MAG: 50S ribosomal protein L11 methyltransferase [Oscillospiraceae bacterium]